MELLTTTASIGFLLGGTLITLSRLRIQVNSSKIKDYIKRYVISFIIAIIITILSGNILFGLMIYVLLFSIQHLNYTNKRNKNDLAILSEYATYGYLLSSTLRTGISLKQTILTVGSSSLNLIKSDIDRIYNIVDNDKIEEFIDIRKSYKSPKIQLFYTCLYVRLKYQGGQLDKVFIAFSQELNAYIKDIRKIDAEHGKAKSTAQIMIYLICAIFLGGLLYGKTTHFYYTIPGAFVLMLIISVVVGIVFWMSSMLKRGDI